MAYKPDMMIYHADCADGFGAAWAAWMKWGDTVEYVPCSYGQEPPEVLGKHVLIGDFSFKREVMERIANGAASIVVLDHHETAEAELLPWRRYMDKPERFTMATVSSMIGDLQRGPYLPICALFDKNRSGAVMTWEFCHPGVEVPMLLRLILPKPVDPLVEAIREASVSDADDGDASRLRAALAKRGLKLVEVGDAD